MNILLYIAVIVKNTINMAPQKPVKRRSKEFRGVSVHKTRQQQRDASKLTMTTTSTTTDDNAGDTEQSEQGDETERGTFSKKAERSSIPLGKRKANQLNRRANKKKKLPDRVVEPSGYRLVDMTRLSKALLAAHVCDGGKLYFL